MLRTNGSTYSRPPYLLNGHLETIYPALFREVKNLPEVRKERINTPDIDFLDLEWYEQGSTEIVILQHGLEGSANRPYMLGMAKCLYEAGYDVLAWSYRGCSGEMNLQKRMYHSGATDDLDLVIQKVLPRYDSVNLIGFSLGGNLSLKYLGEAQRDPKIKKAVAISTPLDLSSGSKALHSSRGWIYEKRFLKNLTLKIKMKKLQYPDLIDDDVFKGIKTLWEFDNVLTAPVHGFEDAEDYYQKCSSMYFLGGIKVPTLVLNAENDPILTAASLDQSLFNQLDNVHLEKTKYGGHVGFTQNHPKNYYWSEERAKAFLKG